MNSLTLHNKAVCLKFNILTAILTWQLFVVACFFTHFSGLQLHFLSILVKVCVKNTFLALLQRQQIPYSPYKHI